MSHEWEWDARACWEFLTEIDEELCRREQERGCVECGDRLDRADYPRKPRGLPPGVGEGATRFSLCCAACRDRQTPPSVRYLGRKVYVGPVILIVAALRAAAVVLSRIKEEYGPGRKTIKRWERWWRDGVPATIAWRVSRGQLAEPVDEGRLPVSLLERFVGTATERLVAALRFLSPLTTTAGVSRNLLARGDPQKMSSRQGR